MSDNVAETQATAHVAEGGANDSCEAMLTGLPGDVCDPAPLRNTPATPRLPGATGNHSVRSHTRGCTAKWGTIGFDKGRSGERPPPNFTQRAVPVTSRCLSISIVPLSLSPPLSLTLPLSSQFCLSASSDKVAGSPSLYMFSLYLMSLHISLSLHLLSLYISLCLWIWRAKTNVAPTPCVNAKRATSR